MEISTAVKFLEVAFDKLNEHYFESALSKPIITIQSSDKTYGHFSVNKIWNDEKSKYNEINISAENLNRNIENIIATLLHEMVHYYCQENKIKDTSRGGVYHNKRFKEESNKRDLIIDYNNKIGWSITTPSDNLIQFVKSKKWTTLTLKRDKIIDVKVKKKSSTRKYTCPECGSTFRATKDINVICADCSDVENDELIYFLKIENDED